MAFDGKQIRNGTVAGAKLVNLTITDAQLAANAITTAKILNLAVDATKLASGAVSEAKIADGAVTTAKIADGNVSLDKLAANSVDAVKIVDASVTLAKLAADSVDATKIADGSVSLAKLAANSVDSSKIVDGSVTGTDIASNTVAAANLVTAYETTLMYRDGTRAMSGSLDLGTGNKIVNLADPTQAQDAATKSYVDAVVTSLDLKASVRAATTANIALDNTTTAVDGVTLANNDRVLVKNQTTASQNGLWVASTSGAWARAIDANTSVEVTSGLFSFVEEGTNNANTGWVLTTPGAITVGTTALAFTQFSGAGSYLAGFGLTLTGNQFAVDFNDSPAVVADVGPQSEEGSSNKAARADHAHALAAGVVTEAALANGSVTSTKIAPEAVEVGHIEPTFFELLYLTNGIHPLTANLDAGGQVITNLDTAGGLSNDNAASVYYVKQALVAGLEKESVHLATTENIDIAALTDPEGTGGAVIIDGATTASSRVLVKDQTNGIENGVYDASTTSPWLRADDFDGVNIAGSHEVRLGTNVWVLGGAENGQTNWTLTSSSSAGSDIVVGTHTLIFAPSSGKLAVADEATDNETPDGSGYRGLISSAQALKLDALPFGYNGKALSTVDLNSRKIRNLADPSSTTDAANKRYVDAQIGGAAADSATSNKIMVAEVTTADGNLACTTAIEFTPRGYVQVFVNGIKVSLTGDLIGDCYFSLDGAEARALDSVVAGDTLYWNGSVAGYELDSTDTLDFDYSFTFEMS